MMFTETEEYKAWLRYAEAAQRMFREGLRDFYAGAPSAPGSLAEPCLEACRTAMADVYEDEECCRLRGLWKAAAGKGGA